MKKLSEDIMTKKIKEVMEQYEPDYSPEFWEKLRRQKLVPELGFMTLLVKYKFWLSVFTIAGGLIIVYIVSDLHPAGKNSAVDPLSAKSLSYSASEKAKESTYSKKAADSGNDNISNVEVRQEERGISDNITQNKITDPFLAANQDYFPAENAIPDMPDRYGANPVIPIMPASIDFGYDFSLTDLIPVEFKDEDSRSLKFQASDNKSDNDNGKLIIHWPEFKSPVKKEGYDKFAGPNKFAIFYSPEIHFSDSIGNIGVSQGIGFNLEGPIRSLVSVSAGLSYQSIDFENKTVFSEKVPPHGPFHPHDTIGTFYYIDSIGIRGGSYKFLELPVSVNYKFIESARSHVWLGAGISAIAFLRQDYTYETIVEGVSDSSSISVNAWENIHPLASLNFSLLYRYDLSSRYLLYGSAQYKQHLVPLGYNSMKLNRLNFQIGIIYRFGRVD